jgi:hypothetical protein
LEHSSHSEFTPATVSARIARFSYGNRWDIPFDISKGHQEIDRKKRPDGWYAGDQMNWLIKKGDRLEEGRKIHLSVGIDVQVGFFDSGLRAFSQQLWYCALDTPPQRFIESCAFTPIFFYSCDINLTDFIQASKNSARSSMASNAPSCI